MGILDFFRPVAVWPVERVKKFMKDHGPGEYNLVDVRQPQEYSLGHIPGARLMPVGQLEESLGELAADKITIIYCNSGPRSQAAASVLSRAGFHRVVCLEGGLSAWQGLVAKGMPETTMVWFFPAHSPEQFIALAFLLEEGTRAFYEEVTRVVTNSEAKTLFRNLTDAEDHHLVALRNLYEEFTGHQVGEEFPFGIIDIDPREESIMEGGISVRKGLAWIEGRTLKDVLELTVGIETVAYDRYLFMMEKMEGDKVRKVLKALAGVEKQHLETVSSYLEKLLETREEPSEILAF